MSLGLKEVLSINTDFVSRKDEILGGNDKAFSKMNDSEIEEVAKALLREELQKTPSLGVTEVEDLSKEAQTIFSDIVAWMLERKKKDYEGIIATNNESLEWRESLFTTGISVLVFFNGLSNFLGEFNKGKLIKYQESLIDTKIAQLRLFADNNGNVLQNAKNKLNEIDNKIRACVETINTLTKAINEYPQKKQPYEDFKNSFNSYNKEQPEENLKPSGTPPTDKFTAWTNTLNAVGIPERDKNDIRRKLVILELECQNLSLKNQDIVKLKSFKCEFISKHTDRDHPENLLRIKPNNRPKIEEFHVLEKMYGRDADSKRGANEQNIWKDPWSSIEDQNNQNRSQYRKFSLWAMCAEITKTQLADEIRRRKNIYNLMFDEFKKEFEKELGEQNSAYNTKKEETNKIAGDINNIVIRRLIELVELKKRNTQEKNQKEQENVKSQEDKVQAEKDLEYIESLNGKLPWEEENKGNFGANIHYKIEYQVSLDVDPVIIDPFSYPITGSTNTKNTNIAQKLIKRLEDRKKFTGMSSRQIASQFVQRGKDAVDICRTFTQFRRLSLAHKNEIMKRKFNRAADCYGAIPTVLKAVLANLEAGFSFNNNKQRQRIS